MQVIYGFLQIILISILIVVLFQLYRRTFLNTVDKNYSINTILKKIIIVAAQVSLFWILWFVIGTLLGFAEWACRHHSLDFNYWRWHGDSMDDSFSMVWGIFTVIISFPLAFFIVKKLNIKL